MNSSETIRILDFRANNIREISKKEKAFGLNLKSWFLCVFGPLSANPYIGILNTILLFGFVTAIFYIAEFFDDDISDILLSKFTIKNKSKYYWS